MEDSPNRRSPGAHNAEAQTPGAQSVDRGSDGAAVGANTPVVAGGYIVGERPALVNGGRSLAVVNNQKSTIYECKRGQKVADCTLHDDMIVSCDTFAYADDIDLVFTASNDGILKILAVAQQDGGTEERALLATFRISNGGLLSVRPAKSSGQLVGVYASGEGTEETTVVLIELDYAALLDPDIQFPLDQPIPIYGGGVGGDNGHHGGFANTVDSMDVDVANKNVAVKGAGDAVVDKCSFGGSDALSDATGGGATVNMGDGQHGGTPRSADSVRNSADLCRTLHKKFVKSRRTLCVLPSRVDVFATDAEVDAIAFAVGKTAMILNMAARKIVFFECFASISCIAFSDSNTFAVGDSRGRIAVYCIDTTKEAPATDNLVMTCNLPNDTFELNATQFRKVLLAFHSSYAVIRDGSDMGAFENFKKVTASVNTLIWHAHGVNCLAFNSNSTMLLSGGEEGVLVVWHLSSGAKKFVTRLGSAIFHILCQPDHGWYILCCEANEILFIDPFALCIRGRIASVAVPVYVGMKVNKDVSLTAMPHGPSSASLAGGVHVDINRANVSLTIGDCPTTPLIEHWPMTVADWVSPAGDCPPEVVGGNVAVYSRSNKLQIYNYVHDREVGSLTLKNVNILSRQDDEFGQDWELEGLAISTDGRVVVTVQSRSVMNSPSTADAEGNLGMLPAFEHELLRNNKKGLLKFWVRQAADAGNGHDTGHYEENTKISNPHGHRTTSIRQLNSDYAFLTTSLDSEFKLWHLIRKRVLQSDDVFATYKTLQIGESDRNVNLDEPGSCMWLCVAVGSYKNLPCFSSSLAMSGGLIAVSHDVVVTFWRTDAQCSSIKLLGAVPLVDDSEPTLDEEDMQGLGGHHMLAFIHPDQPRLILHSKRSRLVVVDVASGVIVWSYPLAEGQVVDQVIYSPQLPNLLVVATSTIDITSNECSGALEMFWLNQTEGNGFEIERFYVDQREISKIVLNMCLTPSPHVRGSAGRKSQKGETAAPAFDRNAHASALVLLTSNFNLETVSIVSDPFSHQTPRVQGVKRAQTTLPSLRKVPSMQRTPHFDVVSSILAALRSDAAGQKKRAKHNLAEQLCKSTEWQHRVRHPMPKSVLGAMVDAGCPTCALPPPNIVLNRLLHVATVRHLRQS
ncbi:WD domain, G-beta repeat containing protein, putative [Babesia bigemina]|uniref:WD domain, G-beta repeat containing protein, putative n=1 Tax=Babesia bigemina TaxID=5866 RepID=A0A061D5D6_BABBI|nr:WD domain, G-beta repeat containing protein, putative [Babesia bigemina]CDR95768.1 WD domain, G-beta repeat containing protein, putative [Babesia bigemina]|eukprot:XP_012767954.1 WD domain, G-beta repeat containing protein, putative [Babesia bigemina]